MTTKRDIPVVIRFPKSLLCAIQHDARLSGWTVDELVTDALRRYVGDDRVRAMAARLEEGA